MTDDIRAKHIARIKALMAKTTDHGATEEEAMGAMAKATELMDKYGISFSEVQGRDDEGIIRRDISPKERWKAEFLGWIGSGLAGFTGTLGIIRSRGKTVHGHGFFGQESDVIFAEWLASAIGDFVFSGYKAALKEYRKAYPNMNRRQLNHYRNGYLLGAARAIVARLAAMKQERINNQNARGALTVISKAQIARNEWNKQNPFSGGPHQFRNLAINADAAHAGRERGMQVEFNKPVGMGRALMIGSK